MSDLASRPGFLRGLTTLPLVGGSVALIGNPSAVDLEPTPVMLEAYSAWLNFELTYLNATLFPPERDGGVSMAIAVQNDGARFHMLEAARHAPDGTEATWRSSGLAAQRRAALVLSTVGCGWQGERVFSRRM